MPAGTARSAAPWRESRWTEGENNFQHLPCRDASMRSVRASGTTQNRTSSPAPDFERLCLFGNLIAQGDKHFVFKTLPVPGSHWNAKD